MEAQGRDDREVIYGIHPVREALRSDGRRVRELLLKEGKDGKPLEEILTLARRRGISVRRRSREDLDRLTGTRSHQGVAAFISSRNYVELEDLAQAVRGARPAPLLLLLDSIEDPRNLGAILRSAEALGVHGVVLPRQRSAPLSSVAAKAAAGALEYLPIAQVTNLHDAINYLKKNGFWVVGAEAGQPTPCNSWDFSSATALVIGGEGKGLRPRVRGGCDALLSIPLRGRISSLNVAVAAGILLYEVWRQRQKRY